MTGGACADARFAAAADELLLLPKMENQPVLAEGIVTFFSEAAYAASTVAFRR